MNSRLRRLLVPATLAALALVSCPGERSQVTIMIGGAPAELDHWEQLAREFTDQSGIAVSLMRQPTDTDQRRQSLIIPLKAGESDPDLFLMDIVWIGQFAASGWLEALDAYAARDGFDLGPFFPDMIEQVDRFRGNLVALPVYVDAGLLYYRTDLLAKYGYAAPPATWSELAEIAARVQAGERQSNPAFWGFVWQGAQYEGLVCNFLEHAVSQGGHLVDRSGALTLDHPANIKALGFMRDLIAAEMISPPNTFTEMKEEEVRTAFEGGNALFERNWPYAWALHQSEASGVRGRVGIALLPCGDGGRHAAALGGWHIGVARSSDNKEAAWKLLKFIVSPEAQLGFAKTLGWNPARQDVYDSPELLATAPHLITLRDAFRAAVARPNLPYYSMISRALQARVNAAVAGAETPADALAKAQQEALAVVGTYGE